MRMKQCTCGKQCSERIRVQKRQWQVWELVLVLKITVKNLLFAHLVVVVHHLASRQFTFHANQIHILGLIISTEESFYMGAMVRQIGILQTALTARVSRICCDHAKRYQWVRRSTKAMGRRARPSTLHYLQKSVWGITACKYENVVGEGFGIIDGKLKIFSGAFNLAKGNDLYHDDSGYMNSESARCVESLARADLAAPYWLSQKAELQCTGSDRTFKMYNIVTGFHCSYFSSDFLWNYNKNR